ncbi:radical SAM protein, partial [Candidatus Dependentiae bacterium]|nr:radical SAM protein [Candidatus Dependentiae bacterium]
KLIDSGIKYFEISMPSLNKTIYKTLTSNGNFDILKKNILELRKYDVYICISAVITKINIKGITELFEFCRACSINSLALNRLCYSGSAIKNFKNLNPEYYELKNLFNLLNTLNSGDSSMPVRFTIPFENCIYKCNELSNLEFSRCRCGIDKWVIDSAGNLRICEQSEEILGSLLKKDFIELSNSENVKNLLNKTKFPECSLCSDFTICRSGCKYVLI